jgi:hypothetical protein
MSHQNDNDFSCPSNSPSPNDYEMSDEAINQHIKDTIDEAMSDPKLAGLDSTNADKVRSLMSASALDAVEGMSDLLYIVQMVNDVVSCIKNDVLRQFSLVEKVSK